MNKWIAGAFLVGVSILGGALAGHYSVYQSKTGRHLTASLSSVTSESDFPQAKVSFESREDPITLLFVGDIMLSRFIQTQIERHGNDYTFPFASSSDIVAAADISFGNLEGSISDEGENQGSMYSFRANPRVIEGLTHAGFDVLSLANNHILDWGKEALVDTISILKENNIIPIGAGTTASDANECARITVKGTTFCFLAFTNLYPSSLAATKNTPGISDFNLEKIKDQIAAIKSKKSTVNDNIIVISLHWGDEYQSVSNALQQRIAHELAVAGADVIVGHHPHVPQEVEEFENENGDRGVIAYSLGNFVFDQNFSKETMEGRAMEITIKNHHIDAIRYFKTPMNEFYQPRFELLYD